MKNKLFVLMMLNMVLLCAITGCKKTKIIELEQWVMTTESQEVELKITGEGKITINWGDGTEETHTVSKNWQTFSHTYSEVSTYTITITGDNLEKLVCISNQLIN